MEELCVFLRETKIERAGVFPFSPEEGTRAARMDHVDAEEARRRAELVVCAMVSAIVSATGIAADSLFVVCWFPLQAVRTSKRMG